MKNKKRARMSMEDIEELATQGKDVNAFFTRGEMMPPLKEVQRVNVDFTIQMLQELDQLSKQLNISRQAVIKSLLMVAIDQHRAAWQHKKVPSEG